MTHLPEQICSTLVNLVKVLVYGGILWPFFSGAFGMAESASGMTPDIAHRVWVKEKFLVRFIKTPGPISKSRPQFKALDGSKIPETTVEWSSI